MVRRAADWLLKIQNADGGWGGSGCGGHSRQMLPSHEISGPSTPESKAAPLSSVEETAVAVEGLLGAPDNAAAQRQLPAQPLEEETAGFGERRRQLGEPTHLSLVPSIAL